MNLKKIATILISFLLLTSCGKTNQDNSEVISYEKVDENAGLLLKDPSVKFNNFDRYKIDQDYLDFCTSLSSFSADLSDKYFKEYNDENNNISISPLSIYMALSLLVECTNNQTRQEVLSLLNMGYNQVSKNTKLLFEKETKEIKDYKNTVLSRSLVTNSLFFEKTLSYKEKCIDDLADKYYCYSHAVDFKNNSKEVIKLVSNFIKEKTYGLIDHEGKYDPQTLLVLLNTLYIKDIWTESGNNLNYSDEIKFTNSDNTITSKKLLEGQYIKGRKQEFEDYSTFYSKTNHGYKIKFLLPKDNKKVEDIFTKENINIVNNIKDYQEQDDINRISYKTKCIFPEFESSCSVDLTKLFQDKYNMNHIFTDADFSNLSDYKMEVSSIIHKTKLKVQKEGIEGAAITEIIAKETAIYDEYKNEYDSFVLNRSFGFVLTDESDVILFSGIVNKI